MAVNKMTMMQLSEKIAMIKPVAIVDPKFLKDGAKDDDAVKSIEGGLEVGNNAKSVHPHP